MFGKIVQKLLIFFLLAGLACVPVPRPAQEPLSFVLDRVEPLVAERRYGEAITILEEAGQTYPETVLPLLKLGQIYLAQHRWLLAEDAFNRALARDLDHPVAMAGLAEALFYQNRFGEALEVWQEVTAAQPQLPGAFTGLGRTYLWLFEFEAARQAFLNQLAHYVDPAAQWYLAALAAPLDVSTAMDYLQAIPATTAQPAERQTPADVLTRRDYLLATLVPFTSQSPQVEVAKATGIALVQVQLWPLAVHALTIAHENSKTEAADAEVLAFLGHALAQSGRPALDLFEQAQKADPDSALPLYFQGIYLRRQGALKAAEALFKQAIELDPENAAIYIELAQTKAQQGNLSVAEALYIASAEVTDGDLQFQLLLVRFYAERGYRIDEAGIPAAEAIIETGEDNAEVYDLLGWMQFLSGALTDSEVSLRQALELEPDLTSARYHLARQLESRGQFDLARAEYQRVVDRDTSGYFREQALKDLQRLNAK